MKRLTGRNEKGDLTFLGKQVYAGDFYESVSALEEYEDAEEQGWLVILPFATDGLLSVSNGVITLNGKTDNGESVSLTGKVCVLQCSKEESERHDKWAEAALKERQKENE